MNKKIELTILIILIIGILTGCGFHGFRFSNMGKYFQSEISTDYSSRNIKKVGIYVFSNGGIIDGTQYLARAEGFPILFANPLNSPVGYSSDDVTMQREYFPGNIYKGSEFNPAKENEAASMEFANYIKNELSSKGYDAQIINDLGHSGIIQYEDIIKNAKEKGKDAAFIVYYSGLNKWTDYAGHEVTKEWAGQSIATVTTSYNLYKGYMYLPNAALASVNDGKILWSTQHYGLVEKAHLFNISGEDYNHVVTEALLEYGAENYEKAAPLAVNILFRPKYWLKSYVDLPGVEKN